MEDLLRKLKDCKVDDGARRSQSEEEDDNSSDDYSDALSIMFSDEEPTDQQEKEDEHCPLCDEKMDDTDLLFKPCASCEYKMCLFCHHKMKEDTGRCPGCRTKYEKQTSSNGGKVTFKQRGGGPVTVSSSFQGLDSD